VISDSRLDLLLNFSLTSAPANSSAQVLILIREPDGAWEGDVETFAGGEVEVGSGRLRMRMGGSSVDFDDSFHVRFACAARGIAGELAITPRCFPYLVQNVVLRKDQPISWLVAPRLVASGRVAWGGKDGRPPQSVELDGASAYHDHNWGRFAGRDLAWEWSCTLATEASPWSLVTVRTLDGARSQVLSQGVVLWEEAHRRATFRSGDVSFAFEGARRPASCLRVPRALGLVVPAGATSMPEKVRIAAARGRDHLAGSLRTLDQARVVVPRDADGGLTVLKEIAARSTFEGEIGGRRLAVDAPAFLELVGRVA
jgi:hypothetical protein